MPHKRKIDDAIVTELYLKGLGYNRIAKIFGVAPISVRKRVVKLGIKTQGREHRKKLPGERGYCSYCGNPLTVSWQKQYCSHSCRATVENTKRPKRVKVRVHKNPCAICGVLHSNKKFCSTQCSGAAKRKGGENRKEEIRLRNLMAVHQRRAKMRGHILTKEETTKVREIYAKCPLGYEVDHIIPISRGGLHVPENLQYLTKEENRRKSNKITDRLTIVANGPGF